MNENITHHALEGGVYQKSKCTDVGFPVARGKICPCLRRDRFEVFQVDQQRVLAAPAQLVHDKAVFNGKTEHNVDTRLCYSANDAFGHAVSDKAVQVMDFHSRPVVQCYGREHAMQTIFSKKNRIDRMRKNTCPHCQIAL